MWVWAKEVNEAPWTRQAGFSRLRGRRYIGKSPRKLAVKIASARATPRCSRSLYRLQDEPAPAPGSQARYERNSTDSRLNSATAAASAAAA